MVEFNDNIKPNSFLDKLTNKAKDFLNDDVTDNDILSRLISIDTSLKILAGIDQKNDPTSFNFEITKTITSITGSANTITILTYLPDHHIQFSYIMLQAVNNMVGCNFYQTLTNTNLPVSAPSGEVIELHPPIKFIEEKNLQLAYSTIPLSMGLSASLNLYVKGKFVRNYK